MKKNKYKILVLSDLKKATSTTLKSTVGVSKMIDADIEFFHVRKPVGIVDNENQINAFKTINKEYIKTKKKIERLINPISEAYGVHIKHSFTFGNIKNEIIKRIDEFKPDLIVLDRKKQKKFKLIGDNVTSYILNKYHGAVLIASDANTFEPNQELSLGILKTNEEFLNLEFANDLIEHSQKPLKSFKIIKNSSGILKTKEASNDSQTIEYVFEENDNTIKSLSTYLSKNNINLLCLNREQQPINDASNTVKTNLKEVVGNLNVSLLLTPKKKLKLQ